MIVKYEGKLQGNSNVIASGRRINVRLEYCEIISKLKEYYDTGLMLNGLTYIKKDLRKGYFICSYQGYKIMFAVMSLSNKSIKDIEI